MSAPGVQKSKVAEPQPQQLHRLAFVRDASILGAEYANSLYGSVKSRLPAFVRARAEKAEDLVSQIADPVYQKLLATAEAALKYTDAKVISRPQPSVELIGGIPQIWVKLAFRSAALCFRLDFRSRTFEHRAYPEATD